MKIGFIGTGKIASAVITGIFKSNLGNKRIIISPRNKSIAKELKKKAFTDVVKAFILFKILRLLFFEFCIFVFKFINTPCSIDKLRFTCVKWVRSSRNL